jgi:UDP-2-acetamido-3-amino-2,3-dideoxy-glucuronate N-acetyltransferase
MENIRIGLAGAGQWGKNHLRNLARLNCLHSVLETDQSLIHHYRRKHPEVLFTRDLHELLSDRNLAGVVIATPAAMHFEHARRFLESGKHVLVEKPLALRVDEAEELIDIAGRRGLVLMVGHILRYHPAVIRLIELAGRGDLGTLRYLYSNRVSFGRIRNKENVLWSFAPHDISVILELMRGTELKNVCAFGSAQLTGKAHDTVMTELEFRNGVKAHVFVSWIHPFKEQKTVVVGSEKMAVFNDTSDQKLTLHPFMVDLLGPGGPEASRDGHQSIKLGPAEPLRQELIHFLECIHKGRQPQTDGHEGLRVLRVLEAAQRSLNDAEASWLDELGVR